MVDRADSKGLTIIELLVVLTIASVLLVSIGLAMTRQDNHQAVERLAQQVLVAARQARNTAVESGGVVQLLFRSDGRQFQVVRASLLGPGPPAGSFWVLVSEAQAGNRALVQAIHGAAEIGVVSSPSGGLTGGLKGELSFNPDGTATAATIYLRDESDTYRQKVVIFGMTGYSQLLTRW